MEQKAPQPGFFYEFKKNRTKMLKAREPLTPEPYYKKYHREKKEKIQNQISEKLIECLKAKKTKVEYEMRVRDSDFEQLQICLPS